MCWGNFFCYYLLLFDCFKVVDAIMVNILNDKLDNDNAWNSEKHTGRAKNFTAEDDTKNDSNRMEIKRFTDEIWIDDVMVDLCKDNIEKHCLECKPWCLCGDKNRTKS